MTEQETQRLPEGIYSGKICAADAGVVGVNNSPLVKVYFKIEEYKYPIQWTGWFSSKLNEKRNVPHMEIVVEKLMELGFSGRCPSELADPKRNVAELLNTNKTWSLDIVYETDQDGKIRKYPEVKWINDPETSGSPKLDHAQAVQTFQGLRLPGLVTKIKGQMGTQGQGQGQQDYTTDKGYMDGPPNYTADDIPF